jgi:hypothetical protein
MKTLAILVTMTVSLPLLAADIRIEIVQVTEEAYLGKNPPSFIRNALVILPDGTHAALICFQSINGCGTIAPMTPPEKTPAADCVHTDYEGGYSRCKRENLGTYRAKRKGDDLIIYTRKGQVRYQIMGPW